VAEENPKSLHRLSHTLTLPEPTDEMMRFIPVFRTTSERWMASLESRRPYGSILTTLASTSFGVFVTAGVKAYLEYGNVAINNRAFDGWMIAAFAALFAALVFGISAALVRRAEALPLHAIVQEIREIRERY